MSFAFLPIFLPVLQIEFCAFKLEITFTTPINGKFIYFN